MSDAKRFEEWLRRAADDPEVRELLARADSQPALPEDALADYYAGALSPDEERVLERRAALSAEASAFLAQLDADVEAAAAAVAPPAEPLARARTAAAAMRERLARGLGALVPAAPAWRVAASVAGIVLVVIAAGQFVDRPPRDFGPAYDGRVTRGSVRENIELPSGVTVTFDPQWPLRSPGRSPRRVSWFAWDTVEQATTYDFELRDRSGRILFSRAGLTGNRTRLPWRVRRTLRSGEEHIWIVTARDRDGATILQGLSRFEMQR